jgi:hypothetical protein
MSATTASLVTLSKLVSRHEVAERTTAFRFEKPSNWSFKADQYLDMALIDPSETDAEGIREHFPSGAVPTKKPSWWSSLPTTGVGPNSTPLCGDLLDEDRIEAGRREWQ